MPPPDNAERRPRARNGALETAQLGDSGKTTLRQAALPRSANPARELLAWRSAVEHLHKRGLPAAVPPFPAAWLRRRGTRPDWVAAS